MQASIQEQYTSLQLACGSRSTRAECPESVGSVGWLDAYVTALKTRFSVTNNRPTKIDDARHSVPICMSVVPCSEPSRPSPAGGR
jgi:hypothetical protein